MVPEVSPGCFISHQVLPLAFGTRGPDLFYLVGHRKEALWRAEITPHGLENAKLLKADVSLAALAG